MSVHRIGDGSVVGEPDQELIERLEKLLDDAKSGVIIGIAYACNSAQDGIVDFGVTSKVSCSQLGSLHVVAGVLAKELR